MRFTSQTSLLATAYWILTTNALPRPRPEVTYSVVNVDGGSQTTPTPTVIYQTITKSDDTPATISVTVTDHATAWTEATNTETATALIPEVSTWPKEHEPHHLPRPHHTTIEGSTVTVTSVITPTTSPTSTKYYDNGQWHTSYAVKHWSSAIESHSGQWAPASASGYVASASGSWQASVPAAPSGWNASAIH